MEQMGKGSLGPGRASLDGVRYGGGDLPLIVQTFLIPESD